MKLMFRGRRHTVDRPEMSLMKYYKPIDFMADSTDMVLIYGQREDGMHVTLSINKYEFAKMVGTITSLNLFYILKLWLTFFRAYLKTMIKMKWEDRKIRVRAALNTMRREAVHRISRKYRCKKDRLDMDDHLREFSYIVRDRALQLRRAEIFSTYPGFDPMFANSLAEILEYRCGLCAYDFETKGTFSNAKCGPGDIISTEHAIKPIEAQAILDTMTHGIASA